MDVQAEFTKLDRSHRQANRIFWNAVGCFGKIDRVTDALLAAAFEALDLFGQETAEMGQVISGGASVGACSLIRRAIEERPEERDAILERLAGYYYHPNIFVASAAIRALEHSETCNRLAFQYLEKVACATDSIRSPDGLALRGLAWIMLYKLDDSIAWERSYELARIDAAEILRHWLRTIRTLRADEQWMPQLADQIEKRA